MGDGTRLGFGEFLTDLREVITAPRRRFPLIHERGALWGSLALLIVPNYIPFHFLGGIYFDQDPIPGYSILVPLLAAAIVTLLETYLLHCFARLVQSRKASVGARGTFRELLQVIGYVGVPTILASIIALAVFLLVPDLFGSLFRNFRIVTISVLIALGVALFIWNVILLVLAMRTTYPMGDARILVAFLLSKVVLGLPVLGLHAMVGEATVDAVQILPIYRDNIARFYSAAPGTDGERKTDIGISIDKLVYRWKNPQRFDLVVFTATDPDSLERRSGEKVVIGKPPAISFDYGAMLLGRVVGMPGETVEIVEGELRINGQNWVEPYIAAEFRSEQSLSPVQLTSSQYLILPENRELLEALGGEVVVDRARIAGRLITNKWPFGWWLHKPGVYLKGHPRSN